MAPRLHPNVSAKIGRKTPYAASGIELPNVTVNSAATISQRRGIGGTVTLYSTYSHEPRGSPHSQPDDRGGRDVFRRPAALLAARRGWPPALHARRGRDRHRPAGHDRHRARV